MVIDLIEQRILHYQNRFTDLVADIEKDPILKTIEGNHLAGILVQIKAQIEEYLEQNKEE
jgi:hypothetical protein